MRESSEGQRLNSRESCPKYGLELAAPAVRNVLRGEEASEGARTPPLLETWAAAKSEDSAGQKASASGRAARGGGPRSVPGLYNNNVRQPAAQHLHEQRRAQLAK